MLSDEDADMCRKYGVLREKNMYGKKSIGVQRSTFIIDGNGIIVKVFPAVRPDGHVMEILPFI